jgi:catechol-2,3-dioxygenase
MNINELKIFTSNLSEQVEFYSSVLDLAISEKSKNKVSLIIGNSLLTLEYRKEFTPYHFAINIPSNKENEALNWLKERVSILLDRKSEIQDFDFWNAKAIYFYDKDNNIVEFIARKNLNNKSDKKFEANSLIEISEIGLPTENIEKEFNSLNKNCNLNIFSGGLERFCAIGNENGLIICINKNIKDWFPTNDKAFSSDFVAEITNDGKNYQIEYKNKTIKVANKV